MSSSGPNYKARHHELKAMEQVGSGLRRVPSLTTCRPPRQPINLSRAGFMCFSQSYSDGARNRSAPDTLVSLFVPPDTIFRCLEGLSETIRKLNHLISASVGAHQPGLLLYTTILVSALGIKLPHLDDPFLVFYCIPFKISQ